MKFYGIKPGITLLGSEIYEVEVEGRRIRGIYLGKMFSRREKIIAVIKAIFYGLLGRAFLGDAGYSAAALSSPSMEIKIGKAERNEEKNFSFEFRKIKIKGNKMIAKNRRKIKIIVSNATREKLEEVLP